MKVTILPHYYVTLVLDLSNLLFSFTKERLSHVRVEFSIVTNGIYIERLDDGFGAWQLFVFLPNQSSIENIARPTEYSSKIYELGIFEYLSPQKSGCCILCAVATVILIINEASSAINEWDSFSRPKIQIRWYIRVLSIAWITKDPVIVSSGFLQNCYSFT